MLMMTNRGSDDIKQLLGVRLELDGKILPHGTLQAGPTAATSETSTTARHMENYSKGNQFLHKLIS